MTAGEKEHNAIAAWFSQEASQQGKVAHSCELIHVYASCRILVRAFEGC